MRACRARRGHHGEHALALVLGRDGGGAGARRLAADVEEIGAGVDQGQRDVDGVRRVAKRPPSAKESGVTLRMPMTSVRSPRASARPSGRGTE